MTEGETLTGVPLVAGRLPGVITPVPLAKTPVRLVDPPAVMIVGVAAKLTKLDSVPDNTAAVGLMHPVMPVRERPKTNAQKA